MAIVRYLAMTRAEIAETAPLPGQIAWMACHFSPYGAGLSNIPDTLPPGSLLILNDRIPLQGQNPAQVAAVLTNTVQARSCSGVLLDFQQPETAETSNMVQVLQSLSCPVAVTPMYAFHSHGPIFLPPCPCHKRLSEHLSPWKGRELWLDIAPCPEALTITADGCQIIPREIPINTPFQEEALHCHYAITCQEDAAVFTLYRNRQDLSDLLTEAEHLGVQVAVGLYQEYKAIEKTALEIPERS